MDNNNNNNMDLEGSTSYDIKASDGKLFDSLDQYENILKNCKTQKKQGRSALGQFIYWIRRVDAKAVEKSRLLENSTYEQIIEFLELQINDLNQKVKNVNMMIPYLIIKNRFTPQQASRLLYMWLDSMKEVSSNRKELIEILKKIVMWRAEARGTLESFLTTTKKTRVPQVSPSYMKSSFPPVPYFPHANLSVINKIFTQAGMTPVTSQGVNSLEGLYRVTIQLEELCGVSEQDVTQYRARKRKDKEPTYTAHYAKTLSHKERKAQLHQSLWHFRKYNRAVEQAGRLRGRMRNFLNPYVNRTCARVDKTGLASVVISPKQVAEGDLATIAFVALTSSHFSVRKGFTLDAQQQGGLDQASEYILKEILMKSQTTQWDLIATIYPVNAVLTNAPPTVLYELLLKWLKFQIPVAKYLEDQWGKGVDTCADRGMMVPRRGTTSVDSSGWNVVCGAWNNIVIFVRGINKALDQPSPILIKCMKLLAADQMKWAAAEGKEEEVDIKVFVNLAKKGITPWNIVMGKAECTDEDVITACQEESVDSVRWLGTPQERSKRATVVKDMICGVPVHNDFVVRELMMALGAYGYKPYNKK